jgi:hypothetical protein
MAKQVHRPPSTELVHESIQIGQIRVKRQPFGVCARRETTAALVVEDHMELVC